MTDTLELAPFELAIIKAIRQQFATFKTVPLYWSARIDCDPKHLLLTFEFKARFPPIDVSDSRAVTVLIKEM